MLTDWPAGWMEITLELLPAVSFWDDAGKVTALTDKMAVTLRGEVAHPVAAFHWIGGCGREGFVTSVKVNGQEQLAKAAENRIGIPASLFLPRIEWVEEPRWWWGWIRRLLPKKDEETDP